VSDRPRRLDRISNVHCIAEQTLQCITLLQGFVVKFQRITPTEQAGTDPAAVKREYLDPLYGLAGAFAGLGQGDVDEDRILDPFVASAHSLGLDPSRRKFRNLESASVHGLIIQAGYFFILLWGREFGPESQKRTLDDLIRQYEGLLWDSASSPASRILVPEVFRLQRFVGDCYKCLADFNPTPYKTDLDREYMTVLERPSPPTSSAARLEIRDGSVWLDGLPVKLGMTAETRRAAVCLLTHLLAAAGDWRSSTNLDEMEQAGSCKFHVGVRWDRIRKKLPPCLHELTEADRRKGVRLLPVVWGS